METDAETFLRGQVKIIEQRLLDAQTRHSRIAPTQAHGEWITVEAAARRLRVGREAVRGALRSGRIEGRRVGTGEFNWTWQCSVASVEDYLRTRKGSPRPTKVDTGTREWIKASEAAAILGRTTQWVGLMVKKRELIGRKEKGAWRIRLSSVQLYQARFPRVISQQEEQPYKWRVRKQNGAWELLRPDGYVLMWADSLDELRTKWLQS